MLAGIREYGVQQATIVDLEKRGDDGFAGWSLDPRADVPETVDVGASFGPGFKLDDLIS